MPCWVNLYSIIDREILGSFARPGERGDWGVFPTLLFLRTTPRYPATVKLGQTTPTSRHTCVRIGELVELGHHLHRGSTSYSNSWNPSCFCINKHLSYEIL